MFSGRPLALLAILLTASCASHRWQTYRLVSVAGVPVLAPPNVAADAQGGALTIKRTTGKPCDSGDVIAIARHGGKLTVTVARDVLVAQAAGWLRQWTAEAESHGCLPVGTGLDFATRVLESVPLAPSAAYRLLHADNAAVGFVELGIENHLQTLAPIMKSGHSPDANQIEITSVTGNDRSLNVDIRESDEAIGVETSWYALRPKAHGLGTVIVPLSTDRRVGDQTTQAEGPPHNRFPFAPDIGFYRLIYKADVEGNGTTTEIIVGAPDRSELQRRTRRVLDDFDACKVSDPELCAVIPRRVALNPVMTVMVNGRTTRVGIRGTVRSAVLQSGGPRRTEDVLPTLSVRKPYAGKLAEVEFDRASGAILDMVLMGGEAIAWQ